jgi:hypothetical protein
VGDGESERARHLYSGYTAPFEYLESLAHIRDGRAGIAWPSLHRHWFDTGSPVAVELQVS